MQRCTPESAGIPSRAIENLLDEWYRYGIEMHGFMLMRHGKVCAEGSWAPFAPDVPHIMFSFSKSFTSTAYGFAVKEGILSLDERLVDIFPDKLPENPSENLKKAKIRHLLSMSCGHETEIPNLGAGDPDWIRAFLCHPFKYEPGTHFLYNTAGTNLLSAILTKKTGLSLTEFLKPRLFEPLGLSDIRCHTLPDGTEMGGAGMSVPLEDMAKFVQFVANRGSWEGRQLLDASWFDEATAKQVENRGAGWGGDPDWQQGYGYQFWRCEPEGVFRGDGAFGQFGVVMTRQDACIAVQSATPRLQAVLTAIWEKLLPQMQDGPLPENPKEYERLRYRLENLELNPVLGVRNPWAEASLNGAVYVPAGDYPGFTDLIGGSGKFVPDGGRLKSLSFRFEGDDCALRVQQDNAAYELKIGMTGHYVKTMLGDVPYASIGRFRAKNKLEAEFRDTRMVSGKRFVFEFTEDGMTLNADSTYPDVGGLADPLTPEMHFRLIKGAVSTSTQMYWQPPQGESRTE